MIDSILLIKKQNEYNMYLLLNYNTSPPNALLYLIRDCNATYHGSK